MSAPAFADPGLQSQATFRAVLTALSRPGTVVACGSELNPPAPLAPAAAAALLTLADFETSLWLSPAFAASEVGEWLRFHTDARLAASPDRAVFALMDLAHDAFDLSAFAQGTAEYPDRSTTIIAQAASLNGAPALRLAGPGIQAEAELGLSPLPQNFVTHYRANGERFPLGVDLIFVAGDRLVGLPRSTRIVGDA